ncbi:MAG: CPBP family intramembrane glutamic endopeptidase [Bacilli bacterium]
MKKREKLINFYKVMVLMFLFVVYTFMVPITPSKEFPLFVKIVIDTLFILITYFMFKDIVNKSFKKIFEHPWKFFKYVLIFWLLFLILPSLYSSIMEKAFNINNPNNLGMWDLAKEVPTYLIFNMIVFAPFIEDMVFRNGFRVLIKNKFLYILISTVVFALFFAYTTNNGATVNILGADVLLSYVFIVPYIITGFISSYSYAKTDNIFVPITIRIIQNIFLLFLYLNIK